MTEGCLISLLIIVPDLVPLNGWDVMDIIRPRVKDLYGTCSQGSFGAKPGLHHPCSVAIVAASRAVLHLGGGFASVQCYDCSCGTLDLTLDTLQTSAMSRKAGPSLVV